MTFNVKDLTTLVIYDDNKNYYTPGEKGFFDNVSGPLHIESTIDQEITVCFSDIQVCYCPEPSTAMLGIVGLTGLVIRRRRK